MSECYTLQRRQQVTTVLSQGICPSHTPEQETVRKDDDAASPWLTHGHHYSTIAGFVKEQTFNQPAKENLAGPQSEANA